MLGSVSFRGISAIMLFAGVSASQSLPVVDFGYAVHQATLNVSPHGKISQKVLLTYS